MKSLRNYITFRPPHCGSLAGEKETDTKSSKQLYIIFIISFMYWFEVCIVGLRTSCVQPENIFSSANSSICRIQTPSHHTFGDYYVHTSLLRL